jgi:hypothetical protein
MGVLKTLAKTESPRGASRSPVRSSRNFSQAAIPRSPRASATRQCRPIAAMPGWKRDVGRRLDALIVKTTPGVRKAVKRNSPLYGVEGQGWFLGLNCFAKAVKWPSSTARR